MHQQIRLKVGKTVALGSPGAMPADPVTTVQVGPGALAAVLALLKDQGYNLRSVGGSDIEGTGQFVFSIDDGRHEPEPGVGTVTEACAAFLRSQDYEAEVLNVQHFDLEDREGALWEKLEEVAKTGRLIHEVFVGTPRSNLVPVQITTLQVLGAHLADADAQKATESGQRM